MLYLRFQLCPKIQFEGETYVVDYTENLLSPVQVKIFVSVYIDRDSDRDSVRDRDKNNREKNYIDRVRDANLTESETDMDRNFISVSDSVYFASLSLSM